MEDKTWFSGLPTTVTIIALFLLAALLLFFLQKGKQGKPLFTTRMIANAAICIALAFILSNLRLFRMPQGGSITPASMLPLIAFCLSYGAGPGLFVCLAYGLLQLLQDPWIVTPLQAIIDYPLAYAGIALCGFCAKLPDKYDFAVGGVLAGLWRFACATFSGVVFFASYAPENQSPLLYSLVYNSFVFVDIAICLVILAIPQIRRAFERMK